jgi:hypothetical protein
MPLSNSGAALISAFAADASHRFVLMPIRLQNIPAKREVIFFEKAGPFTPT